MRLRLATPDDAPASTALARATRARPAFSVSIERAWRGRSAGLRALEGLVQEAEKAGFRKLISRVFVEIAASRALLRSHGLREVGVYEKHAQLDGVWRDVVIVARLLSANVLTG